MNKKVSSGNEAMQKILEGVNLVADPVISTLSPKGRTVVISKSAVIDYGIRNFPLEVTKDGYRTSASISSPDPEVQVGVMFIQQAIEKQMLDAGDATTTTALLVKCLLEEGLKEIENGKSHVEVKASILKGVEHVVSELKKMSTEIAGNAELVRQVATVSANGDETIGNLIAEAFEKIGEDGVIDIQESKGLETKIEVSPGFKFPKGYASPYFLTKGAASTVLENPYILIYDRAITKLEDKENGTGLMPVLQKILTQQQATGNKRPLMIFCDSCDGEALATLTFNTQQGVLQSCVVELQFMGEKKREFMEDIAAATGGTFVNELKGVKLENVGLAYFGQANKVVVSKDETVIIGGKKDEDEFEQLVADIKAQEENEVDANKKEQLKKRGSRLTGMAATLSIGGVTEVEMKERYDRADDAVRATASAVEEGYVPGGGTVFLRIGDTGSDIVNSILTAPLKQICENSAVNYDTIFETIILGDVIKIGKNIGYNAKTGVVEDLVKAGIIEPAKSNRCAIQNAASVVCSILTSKFLITDTL